MNPKSLLERVKYIWRLPIQTRMRRAFTGDDVRIVSSNCIGGFLYHDLGKRFLSPTINLSMGNFVSFCERLDEYMARPPREIVDPACEYPQAGLDDVLIRCIHYKSYGAFREKWDARAARFRENADSPLVIIASDAQVTTDDEIERFHKLPYPKICYTVRRDIPYPEFIRIPNKAGEAHAGDLTRFIGPFGARKFERYFDCVAWLNQCAREKRGD